MNFIFDEASKKIKHSEPVEQPKKTNKPSGANRIKYTKSALQKQLEAFEYMHPSPEKEYPAEITNPAIDLPTKEHRQNSTSGFINLTVAENSGIQFPTADSDKATTIKDGNVESLRDPKSITSLYENGLEFMPDINNSYIFSNLDTLIFYLPEHLNDLNYMTSLKNAFNEIFKSKCKEIAFSNNTDNLFFGIRVYPVFNNSELQSFCNGNTNINEFTYNIEFDSKLWDPIISLDASEMTALVIYAIYYSTNKNVLNSLVNNITAYQLKNSVRLELNHNGKYEILNYAISDSMMKAGSPFNKTISDLATDKLIHSLQMSGDIEHGLRKLENNLNYFKQDADNRFIILGWALRVLDDYENLMLHAVHQIKKCIDITGSLLERQIMLRIVNTIERMDHLVNENYIEEATKEKDDDKYHAFTLKQSKNELVDIKNNLNVTNDSNGLSSIASNIINNIDIIQTILSNPNLDSMERSEWDSVLLDYLNVKDSLIATKDYLNHFGGSRIPTEYLSKENNI